MEQLYREVGYSRQGLSQHQKSEVQIDKLKSMLELAKVWWANHPGFSARTLFYSILKSRKNIPGSWIIDSKDGY
ncbi:MAG: hypothetical protein IPO33_02070 [Saprospiraceae bacterium]|nr:hypothetical protein [Candidatus Brachybacter algidus]